MNNYLVDVSASPLVKLSDDEKDLLRRQIAKAEIREKIKDLYYVKRWGFIDVMKELRVDPTTLATSLNEVKEEFARNAKTRLKQEIATNVYHSYRNILAELWFTVDNAKSNYERIKALEVIGNIEEKNIKVLQDAGILDKPTEKQEITHKHEFEEMMEKWRIQRKKIIETEAV